MRNAKLIVTAFEVQCPKCHEPKSNDDGSITWEAAQIHTGRELECYSCQTKFKLPKTRGDQ